MFALIISILAIILAVAIAGISIYYGGEAFNGNKLKADAAKIINQASQIEAAMTIYNTDNKGNLVVGGRDSENGLFDYLLAGDYLKDSPDGNGGKWELKCSDNAFQAAFEADDNPASCGADGVILTLSGVNGAQCNMINVLQKYTYTTDVSESVDGIDYNADGDISDAWTEGTLAIQDSYVPTCTNEPNAACCDGL